jgi:ribosomal protein L11 methyltransferase
MVLVKIPVEPEEADNLTASLWEAGTVGIVEGLGYVEAFFKDADSARAFGEPQESPDVDWVQQTRDSFTPLLIGERFYVTAPWHTDPTPDGRLRLEINPGLQFGTGQHATTRKCLEALERVVKPGASVLDVGSGSGILSIAAKMLGASHVIACDVDAGGAAALSEALAANASSGVMFFNGSVDAVRSRSFDVVVANISEEVRGELWLDFERVAPVRVLSGFQDDDGNWDCVVA